MPYATPGATAYLNASQYLIDLAVWDGFPATGAGGTADAVAYAHEHGRSTVVVWPEGAQRS
jgi:hypothetical protein